MFISDKTLLDDLRSLAGKEPQKHLLGDEAGWSSAAEVLRSVEGLGRRLVSLGVHPGDAVILRAGRCKAAALMMLALRAAGALVVLADPREDISQLRAQCDADIPVGAIMEQNPQGDFVVMLDGRSEVLALDADAPGVELPQISPMDPAFVIFTSGSTGKSKAVVICENNLISNLVDSHPLGYYRDNDIALGALPLVHIFGLVLLAGVAVLGYGLFFPEKTDIPSLLSCIEREKITRMNGVPSLYLALAEQSAGYDISSLRAGFIGGGPVTPAQFVKIEETLGMTLVSVYGMSESVGISCSSYLDPQQERATGVGRVYPMNHIAILTADGVEAEPGQEGEIFVGGPMRMLGYYGSTLQADELFPTGDLGYLDGEGVLHLSGRKKDVIIRNGNNISSHRIEEALLSLPGIRAAAVVGLPDDRQGEVPYAMIVGEADLQKLQTLLHKNELPAGVLTVEALPMTGSGKPDKQRIGEVLRAWRNG